MTTTSDQAEYPSQFIPDKIWGEWDPVAVIVREARKHGVQVWPSMCVMACGSKEPRGILKQHPEWALRDKGGNPMGYLSAGNPEVHKYVISVLSEIATKYQPDGIMLDYCRYPGDEAAMDPVSQAKFDAAHPVNKFPMNSAERRDAWASPPPWPHREGGESTPTSKSPSARTSTALRSSPGTRSSRICPR